MLGEKDGKINNYELNWNDWTFMRSSQQKSNCDSDNNNHLSYTQTRKYTLSQE